MMAADEQSAGERTAAPVPPSFLESVERDDLYSETMNARQDWRNNGTRLGAAHNNLDQPGAPSGSTARWIDDAEVTTCYQCGVNFDWAKRAILLESVHKLSSKTPRVSDPLRVCDPCASTVEPSQADLRGTTSNASRENKVDFAAARRHFNSPIAFTLGHEIRKAAFAMNNLVKSPAFLRDQSIPMPLLAKAVGLAFITVVKAGFVFTGRMGTGLVVSRTADGGWSAPSAIATAGMGWGAQIGAEVTDFIFVLMTRAAVNAFGGRGQISMGAEIGVAIGPVGRSVEADVSAGDGGFASMYSYAHSKGLFAGVSLEGKIVGTRNDVNLSFYGCPVAAQDLLSGRVARPRAAEPLYEALELINPFHGTVAGTVTDGTGAGAATPAVADGALSQSNSRVPSSLMPSESFLAAGSAAASSLPQAQAVVTAPATSVAAQIRSSSDVSVTAVPVPETSKSIPVQFVGRYQSAAHVPQGKSQSRSAADKEADPAWEYRPPALSTPVAHNGISKAGPAAGFNPFVVDDTVHI